MSESDRIEATRTSFDILDTIHELKGASAAELIAATGLSRGGVYKHLRTLMDVDAVENQNGTYVIGPKFNEYGLSVTGSRPVLSQRDKVDKLSRSLNAPTNLWFYSTPDCHCLYTTVGDEQDQYPRQRGDTESLVESPAGKAILAHLPSDRRDSIVDGDETIAAQIETIRERSLLEEPLSFAPEWVSIATAVRDPEDEPIASLEVVIPAERARGIDVKNNISGLLTETANRMRVEMLAGSDR
ncbi:DNA-binding IclR family transcriptional regulator [Halorubrum trapanicum]|uniref:DNA-binding IclR family transcriptional regulator n=1 Tax=Halorubrum trapanicum TaxID=29284 RepID=A0A8J7REV2_9EURY|nr:helix-turn-helix domain-containing protein [Halorubrum trapanicum]MBP1902863.1 DNA-binding IclR family transcriptional regulator [Halorubrum trapanicum]